MLSSCAVTVLTRATYKDVAIVLLIFLLKQFLL